MKMILNLLVIWLGAFAGMAVAAETGAPALPDPAYCSQRDADPEKCVIQNGPPPAPIVRKPATPPTPPAPQTPVPGMPKK
ncbi:hypothetical protein D3C83_30730 [compost metagenome]